MCNLLVSTGLGVSHPVDSFLFGRASLANHFDPALRKKADYHVQIGL